MSTTDWMVETQLCKLRGTSDTFVRRACSTFYLWCGVCELNLRYVCYYSASHFFLIRSSARMCLCQTPGRHRPLLTGRFVNTAVRDPALDATVHRYVQRLCVFPCCCVLAGASILTVMCLRCCWKQATTPLALARPRKQGRQAALHG